MAAESSTTTRLPSQLRPISLERNAVPYAEGSCLISFGETRVLCAASVELSVPSWRKGKGEGWITAEYAMLPRATRTRTARERSQSLREELAQAQKALEACRDVGERKRREETEARGELSRLDSELRNAKAQLEVIAADAAGLAEERAGESGKRVELTARIERLAAAAGGAQPPRTHGTAHARGPACPGARVRRG